MKLFKSRRKSTKLLKKCFLILYIVSMVSLIISCVKQSTQYIWESISLMLIIVLIDIITSLHIKHKIKKQQRLPINFNYKVLPIDISRTDGKKVGAMHSSITYIYINLRRKTITFPESRYDTERKYTLTKISNIHAGNILELKHAKKKIKITVHRPTEQQIKLLKAISCNSHKSRKMKDIKFNNSDNIFLKILKNHM